jgi:hypothetical protein
MEIILSALFFNRKMQASILTSKTRSHISIVLQTALLGLTYALAGLQGSELQFELLPPSICFMWNP